eukprot:2857629-Lingulodinium_polyedra.AAC.1
MMDEVIAETERRTDVKVNRLRDDVSTMIGPLRASVASLESVVRELRSTGAASSGASTIKGYGAGAPRP